METLLLRTRYIFMESGIYIVAERKASFSPIPASGSNFNPQNTASIPEVKNSPPLDLDEKSWFSFGHYRINSVRLG